LLLLIIASSYAQLIDTGKVWNIMYGPTYGCASYYCQSYCLKAMGDTIVDELTYHKIMRNNDSALGAWIFAGLARDSADKVYSIKAGTSQPCLLYDFGCMQGESLSLDCSGCNGYFYVDSISYSHQWFSDSMDRKIIYLTYLESHTREIWIEGIGSLFGLLNGGQTHCVAGGSEALLCCSRENDLIYQAVGFNECFLHFDRIEETTDNHNLNPPPIISPNPFNPSVTMTFHNPQRNAQINIYTINGRKIVTLNGFTGDKYTWKPKNSSSGIFLVKIQVSGRIFTNRICMTK